MPSNIQKRKKFCIVGHRDLRVFRFLFEQKVVAQGVVQDRFFGKNGKSTSVSRLQKLWRYGYINKGIDPNTGKAGVFYSLTEKGYRKIEDDYSLIAGRPRLLSDSVQHDLVLSEARHWLEKFKRVKGFYPENLIQRCKLDIPEEKQRVFKTIRSDAILKLQVGNDELYAGLEYELSKKSLERYIRKINSYYTSSKVSVVFYLCRNQEIVNLVKQADRMVRKKSYSRRLHFSLFDSQSTEQDVAHFISSCGKDFILR